MSNTGYMQSIQQKSPDGRIPVASVMECGTNEVKLPQP